MKKKILILALLASTASGCANLRFQWSASYQTDSLVGDLERAKAGK